MERTLKCAIQFLALTPVLFSAAVSALPLPLPAVEILQGPPAGNYCGAKRATALFDVNVLPGGLYFGDGIFRVNGQIVLTTAVSRFIFPRAGVQTAEYPLPLENLPGPPYPAGTIFSTMSRYYDANLRPTYENEITIRCDTGETISIRNTDLTVPPPPAPVPLKGTSFLALLLAAMGVARLRAQVRPRFVVPKNQG